MTESLEFPKLPHDILRLIFEQAIKIDSCKAVKYALVSKLVCLWYPPLPLVRTVFQRYIWFLLRVEAYLYSNVQLYSRTSVRRFVRTLVSSTKPKQFFSKHVKSLSIAYSTHDSELTARVLFFCDGIENLTIWVIPSHDHHHHHHRSLEDPSLGFHYYQDGIIPNLHYVSRGNRCSTLHSSLQRLRPKRLVLLIDEPIYHCAQIGMTPDFSLGLFSNLTHLFITNRWTEWSTWSWSWDTTSPSLSRKNNPLISTCVFDFIPKLTHLSLEIQVGKWQISSASIRNFRKLVVDTSLALATILTSSQLSPHPPVLLCVLSFDQQPDITARMIKEQTNHHLTLQLEDGSQYRYIDDSRLVFAYDKEPFSEREAGSPKVRDMWKNAEENVRDSTVRGQYYICPSSFPLLTFFLDRIIFEIWALILYSFKIHSIAIILLSFLLRYTDECNPISLDERRIDWGWPQCHETEVDALSVREIVLFDNFYGILSAMINNSAIHMKEGHKHLKHSYKGHDQLDKTVSHLIQPTSYSRIVHYQWVALSSDFQRINVLLVSTIRKQGVQHLVPAVFRTWASGAATKQVKCKSVFIPLFSFEGCCVCPRAELCRWILVKRSVDSKSFPRSSGVLSSLRADYQRRWYYRVYNVPLQRSMNFWSGLSGM